MNADFKLRGIIPALVTPFSAEGQVDEDSLREIVRFHLRHKVHAFFPCGTTGMGPAMQLEERKKVAEIVVDEVNHRIPVIIQVGASDPLIGVELARHAEKIGAEAVASLTPFYYHPDETAIIEHYRRLSQSTNLPLLVYNIPSNTGINVNAKLLQKLAKIPNIVGVKDSSRDFSQLVDYLQVVPEGFNVINGTDSYHFSAFCAGTHAAVSATSNAFPDLFVEMYEAYGSKDLEKGKALQLKINALRAATSEPQIAPHLEALRMRGLRSGLVRPPLRSMTGAEIAALRNTISQIIPEIQLSS
jgi:4-hydroxy-tetrahydrodipicolinate synthase